MLCFYCFAVYGGGVLTVVDGCYLLYPLFPSGGVSEVVFSLKHEITPSKPPLWGVLYPLRGATLDPFLRLKRDTKPERDRNSHRGRYATQ